MGNSQSLAEKNPSPISFERSVKLSDNGLQAQGQQTTLLNMASLKLDVHPHPNIIKHFREKSDLLFSSASDLKASLINMPSLSGDAPDNPKKTMLGIFADSVPNIVRSC